MGALRSKFNIGQENREVQSNFVSATGSARSQIETTVFLFLMSSRRRQTDYSLLIVFSSKKKVLNETVQLKSGYLCVPYFTVDAALIERYITPQCLHLDYFGERPERNRAVRMMDSTTDE